MAYLVSTYSIVSIMRNPECSKFDRNTLMVKLNLIAQTIFVLNVVANIISQFFQSEKLVNITFSLFPFVATVLYCIMGYLFY